MSTRSIVRYAAVPAALALAACGNTNPPHSVASHTVAQPTAAQPPQPAAEANWEQKASGISPGWTWAVTYINWARI
jgi:hypothetical protein